MFTSVEEIIEDAKNGKIFIITDDESRENEGDLIFAGQFADAKKINFLITHGRGLVCAPISNSMVQKFNLPQMLRGGVNESLYGTAFTVSVGAKKLKTTGISASDRATTVQVLADENAKAEDLSVPGHIFPLIARDGGVLERDGHTEASVEICKLAGLKPIAVLCEILDIDGSPARLNYIEPFAKQHGLKITTVAKIKQFVQNKK